MLTNQFLKIVRRVLSDLRTGDSVDVSGWGPFPPDDRYARRIALPRVVRLARH